MFKPVMNKNLLSIVVPKGNRSLFLSVDKKRTQPSSLLKTLLYFVSLANHFGASREQAFCSDEVHPSHVKSRPLGVQRRRVSELYNINICQCKCLG